MAQDRAWAEREHREMRSQVNAIARELDRHSHPALVTDVQNLENLALVHHSELGVLRGVGIGIMGLVGVLSLLVGGFGYKISHELRAIRRANGA